MDYVRYLVAIRNLREEFAHRLNLDRYTEAYKIWSRWVITHRSLFPQTAFFLPSDDVKNDSQIIMEMIDKGATPAHAQITYDWLTCKAAIINKIPIIPELDVIKEGDHMYAASDHDFVLSYSIERTILNKMCNSHIVTTNDIPQRHRDVWLCYTLYDLLEGKGLQWAVPRPVMNSLSVHFGCRTELFASPINYYFRDYYSLFNIDQKFGSRGNFFNADPEDFSEGAFQINPPFIDPIFTQLTKRILGYLETAESRANNLTFIYIMPDWTDCEGYDRLIESKYCVKLIELKKDAHYYYQYDVGKYISARFGSCVIIMSKNPNIVTPEAEQDIRHGFQFISR